MAEEKKQVVLEIKIDDAQAKKRLGEIAVELSNVRKNQSDLDKARKAGTVTDEEYGKQTANNRLSLNALGKEQTVFTKSLENSRIKQEQATGSLLAMRAELNDLERAYAKMSEAQRNSAEGKAHLAALNKQREAVEDVEKSMGNYTRGVGRYQQAIERALSGNSQFAEGLQFIKEGYATLTDTIGDVGKSVKDQFNAAGKAVDGTASSFGTAQKAAFGFGIGLKALGIGLLITAISAVVTYFSRFEEGAEKLEQFTAGIGGAIDLIAGRLGAFGKQIVDVFTSPVAQIQKLGSFLKKAFTDPKGALEDIRKGADSFVVDLGELSKAAIKAGKEMAGLTKQLQELEDAETAVRVAQAKQRGEVELLMLAAKNRGKSEQDRINGLKRAGDIEKALTSQQLEFARKALEVANKKDEIDKRNGKLAEERSKEAVDAEVEYVEILNASAIQRQAIQNRESALQEEINKDKLEKNADYQKKLAENRRMAIELEIAQSQEGSDERLSSELKMLAFERDQKQKLYKEGSVGYMLAQEEYGNDVLKMTHAFSQKQLDEQKKRADEFIALTNKEYSEAQAATEDYYQKKKTAASNDFANGITSHEQYNEQLKNIDGELINQQIQNAKDYAQSTTDLEQQAAERRISIRQNEANQKKVIQQAEFATAQAFAGAFTELSNLIAGQGEELSGFQKAAALFQIGIDTASSLSALTLSSTKVSGAVATASGPFGLVTGPLAYAAYYGTGLTTILSAIGRAKELLSANPPSAPQFYDGGFTSRGNPREQATNLGGKPYIYHKNEYVAPHDVLADPAGAYLVNRLEGLRLKKRGFADGGFAPAYNYNTLPTVPVPYDHFAAAARYSISNGNPGDLAKMIGNEVARQMAKLPPQVLDVRDSLSAQERLNNTEKRTSIK